MIDTNTFRFFQSFLLEQSGYVFTEDKKYLLDSKLAPVAEKHSLANVTEVANKLRELPTHLLKRDVVDAMTINETFFFRDNVPFQLMEQVVVEHFMKEQDRQSLNFWSAACSSGQEPYSMAIVMDRIAKSHRPVNYKVFASDISTEIIEKATEGIYNDFEVKRGLAEEQVKTYFDKTDAGWRVKDFLRQHITYKAGNLVRDFYTGGPYDLVFLRNVLIYFDAETKTRVLEKMHRVISPNGYLILGAPETVMGLGGFFSPANGLRGFYKPNVK